MLESAAAPVTVSTTFDPITGRLASKTWPTGYTASYGYTNGYLTSVSAGGGAFQSASINILAYDSQGRITQYKHGNNVVTDKSYAADTGRLTRIAATLMGSGCANCVQSTGYWYDSLGNLTKRDDSMIGWSEIFSYDNLNRLTTAQILGGGVGAVQTTEARYDARGNLTYKSDVGQYWYDSARPNRLTNITLSAPSGATPLTGTRTLAYAFDDYLAPTTSQLSNGVALGNGNLMYTVSHDATTGKHTARFESYTSFNMPSQISYANIGASDTTPAGTTSDRTLNFIYGPEHQRVKQITTLTNNAPSQYQAGTVWYLNGEDGQSLTYEKEIKANGTTEHKHYLQAAGITFALYTKREGASTTQSTRYFQQDHLGSITVITDEAGAVAERLSYDPWGKRRNASGLPDPADSLVSSTTDRGYTEHEHLDEVGVIHMNGRIYDPLIARFMSADPTLQAPFDLRSFNRYSYVWNNPLKAFDPSGYAMQCSFNAAFGWDCYDDGVVTPPPSGGDSGAGGSGSGSTPPSTGQSMAWNNSNWWQITSGATQTIGGGTTIALGAGICGAGIAMGGAPGVATCAFGGISVAYGMADLQEGSTKFWYGLQGVKSEGLNYLKDGFKWTFTELGGTAKDGETAYDSSSLGVSLLTFSAGKVATKISTETPEIYDALGKNASKWVDPMFVKTQGVWDRTKFAFGLLEGQVGQLVNRGSMLHTIYEKSSQLWKDLKEYWFK